MLPARQLSSTRDRLWGSLYTIKNTLKVQYPCLLSRAIMISEVLDKNPGVGILRPISRICGSLSAKLIHGRCDQPKYHMALAQDETMDGNHNFGSHNNLR